MVSHDRPPQVIGHCVCKLSVKPGWSKEDPQRPCRIGSRKETSEKKRKGKEKIQEGLAHEGYHGKCFLCVVYHARNQGPSFRSSADMVQGAPITQ